MKKPFTIEQTWLSCINCGYKVDLLDERKFRCPKCGNLYEIKHNLNWPPITGHYYGEYTAMFKERALPHNLSDVGLNPKYRSGVWRFKEWIMPFLSDDQIITLNEGAVPIVPAGKNLRAWVGGDIELFIILEGMTPTGSFKDFGGTVLISVAKAAGVQAVACASTGDTSAMAAAYAAAADLKCAVILPQGKVTAIQLAQPLVHGAKVILLPGDFDDCMRVMQELVSQWGVYPANSLNPARIEGHQATVFLIAQHFGWRLPDWIVLPVGNGSNCSSVGKGLRMIAQFDIDGPFSRILGCQSEAANPLERSWRSISGSNCVGLDEQEKALEEWRRNYQPMKTGETAATAARIGDPVSREKVMREIVGWEGAMQVASEKDLNEGVAVCGKDGYFVCPQTGTALAGVRNAVKEKWIKPGERVVVVSTATGLKFTETAAAHLIKEAIPANDCKTETVAKILDL